MIQKPVPRLVKCGVIFHAGDNLESHSVGGFSTCFSSLDVCRMCHIGHKDLLEHIHDFDGDEAHDYWNEEEYDAICHELEENDGLDEDGSPVVISAVTVEELGDHLFDEFEEPVQDEDDEEEDDTEEETGNRKKYGLRKRCPFNSLKSFHAIYSFPPDLMHDLFEGVISQDLCGIIKILSSNGWFSIKEYNQALQNHQFKSYEMNDRPQPIVSPKAKKLRGKAISLWLQMRCFGMIIQPFVKDIEDPVLSLALKLSEITEKLTAAEYRGHEIDQLEQDVLDYLDHRKVIFEEYPEMLNTPKPKATHQNNCSSNILFFKL